MNDDENDTPDPFATFRQAVEDAENALAQANGKLAEALKADCFKHIKGTAWRFSGGHNYDSLNFVWGKEGGEEFEKNLGSIFGGYHNSFDVDGVHFYRSDSDVGLYFNPKEKNVLDVLYQFGIHLDTEWAFEQLEKYRGQAQHFEQLIVIANKLNDELVGRCVSKLQELNAKLREAKKASE
jgi:hypothetical protein